MALNCRFQLVLSHVGDPVSQRRDGSPLSPFRSITGSGVRIVGPLVEEPENDELAVVGRDCDTVPDVQLQAYKNNDPALFDALGSLNVGDRVNVWTTINHDQYVDSSSGHIRSGPRYGRITAVQVIERASSVAAAAPRRPAFSEVRPM